MRGDNEALIICVLIILAVMTFGGQLGLGFANAPDTSNNKIMDKPEAPHGTGLTALADNLIKIAGWIFNGLAAYFSIMFFSVPNMPAVIGMVYWLITLILGFILLKFARGTNS